MIVTVVIGPNRRFLLKKQFVVRLEYTVSGGVIAQHPNLPVSGYGDNTAEAMEEFCEMFELQWEALVERPIGVLTQEAYVVRQELLAIAEPL